MCLWITMFLRGLVGQVRLSKFPETIEKHEELQHRALLATFGSDPLFGWKFQWEPPASRSEDRPFTRSTIAQYTAWPSTFCYQSAEAKPDDARLRIPVLKRQVAA